MFSFIVGECVAFVLRVCQVLWLDFDPGTMYFDRYFFCCCHFPNIFQESLGIVNSAFISSAIHDELILPFNATEFVWVKK
jgi:hypothetical protein